jgi:hypothetical protein
MYRAKFNDIPTPLYVVASQLADVSGCDTSGNPLDTNGNVITNNVCGFLQIYNCGGTGATAGCVTSNQKVGLLTVGIIGIVGLIAGIALTVYGSRNNSNPSFWTGIILIIAGLLTLLIGFGSLILFQYDNSAAINY